MAAACEDQSCERRKGKWHDRLDQRVAPLQQREKSDAHNAGNEGDGIGRKGAWRATH